MLLIGFRAVGKTSIGQKIAKKKQIPFWDADQELEAKLGCSLTSFAKKESIEKFRQEEFAMLQTLLVKADSSVIALGGGFVDHHDSFHLVKQSKQKKVLIDAPKEIIWQRLQAEGEPERVQTLSSFDDLSELYNARMEKFRSIASLEIVNDNDIEQLVDQLMREV